MSEAQAPEYVYVRKDDLEWSNAERKRLAREHLLLMNAINDIARMSTSPDVRARIQRLASDISDETVHV